MALKTNHHRMGFRIVAAQTVILLDISMESTEFGDDTDAKKTYAFGYKRADSAIVCQIVQGNKRKV